jgi:16S rRNA C967 or C1407 C5-methylase (RsmB/RsmF family)/NOL1/NOP2/fmu family ribosome biogenesis protein
VASVDHRPGPAVPLPEAFAARQQLRLGSEAEAFLAALDEPSVRALRVNERKTTLAELTARLRIEVDPVPWAPSATYLPADVRLGGTAEHRAGLFYLQEPSAMAVVEAAGIEPHHRVLDVSAAPGGKSTHAASKLGAPGMLVVNEVIAKRIGPLIANIDAWGYPNVATASSSAARLADLFPAAFDRVIVDAPCSGEALLRRDQAARAAWSEAHVRGSARRQAKLLASAAATVAPGGRLIYSTCTFNEEENEAQLARFLDKRPGWRLAELPFWAEALPLPVTSADAGPRQRALMFYPHRCRCDGQFVAALDSPRDSRPVAPRRNRPGRAEPIPAAWTAFAGSMLTDQLDPARLHQRGDSLFLIAAGAPNGVTALLRPGLPLGRFVGTTFRPDHALAMTLEPGQVRVHEELDDEALAAFRAGRPVSRRGPPGWVLVTLGRWPVGWARRTDNQLRARLPGHARSASADRAALPGG